MATRSRAKKSTNVRFFMLRTGFRIGEALAPRRCAAVANRLWFRLPGPRRIGPVPATATSFSVPWRHGSGTTTVRGHHWGTGPTVLLVHGWGGDTADLSAIAAVLVTRGFRVVAFDAPGHGRSDDGPFGPGSASPDQFAGALRPVAERYGPIHGVVAHSLGCTATVMALRAGLDTARLVLVAPFVGGPDGIHRFADTLGLGPRSYSAFAALAERTVGRPVADFSTLDPAVELPTLVTHDRHDRTTPFEDARRIADHWPRVTLRATDGLGHKRILHQPDVLTAVADFLAAPEEDATDHAARDAKPVPARP